MNGENNNSKNINIERSENEMDEETKKDILENKDKAAASYFLIISPILLMTRKDSKFIQHHASQSFVLLVIVITLWIMGSILSVFSWLILIVAFVSMIGFVQAFQGEYYKIPYIYDTVKDGVSVKGFLKQANLLFNAVKNVFLGLFPKNKTKKNVFIEKSLPNTNESLLEKRVSKLEMFIAKQNYFPKFISKSAYLDKQRKEIKEILSNFLRKDENTKVIDSDLYYELHGSFGIVFVGATKNKVITWGNNVSNETVFSSISVKEQ
jgi:uncharacterized membrane protein